WGWEFDLSLLAWVVCYLRQTLNKLGGARRPTRSTSPLPFRTEPARRSWNDSTTSRLPSLEQSSTTISSRSPKVCAKTPALERLSSAARLNVGMIALTRGDAGAMNFDHVIEYGDTGRNKLAAQRAGDLPQHRVRPGAEP